MMRSSCIVVLATLASATALATSSHAAVIAGWNFESPSVPLSPSTTSAGVTVSVLNPVGSIASARVFAGGSYGSYLVTYNTSNIYFSITVAPGATMNVDSISFSSTESLNSMGAITSIPVTAYYSVNSDYSGAASMGTNNVAGVTSGDTSQTFIAYAFSQNPIVLGSGTYYFRLSTGNLYYGNGFYVDNLNVNGSVLAAPEPAALGMLGLGALALLRRRSAR